MKRKGIFFWLSLCGLLIGEVHAGNLVNSKHNLSVSGPGTVKASQETRICIFCHTPHNARPVAPLWNRLDSGSVYTPYTSSTALATPGQPTGASILCLSCHDGTIALGEVMSEPAPIDMVGGTTTIPQGPGFIGTDLSDDHPISFPYTNTLALMRGELVDPGLLTGAVRLDENAHMQCTTCHDPHNDTFGHFLVLSNRYSALCTTCHEKDFWSQSSHSVSSAAWDGRSPDPWPHTPWNTVAENGCENCHRPHSAGEHARLLNEQVEEENCFPCHNGHVAPLDLEGEFMKSSRHPVGATLEVHTPDEPAVVELRHVECSDCHDPHAATSGSGTPSGPLTGVRGVSIAGNEVAPASFEYEICFRCHADSPNKPAPRTTRQFGQTNVRLEFDPNNPSFHPVAAPGVNSDVPSLIPPLTTNSIIRCTDCHNNDEGPGAGGTGPAGPHGSRYPPLLERRYDTADFTQESAFAYALCYKCHSRNSILNNESFKEHKKHVRDEKTPCNVCHDPHGVSLTQGNGTNNSKLINFDTTVVSPNSKGKLWFESRGRFHGACYLKCHGKNHDPKSY
ncbi:MAG: hypothetical protein D6795_01380 [Deltaproteobacteria bacterium]|nr:MAG: hypothetical protein D6795_01380 [Deltaproteobacteria bacterium]